MVSKKPAPMRKRRTPGLEPTGRVLLELPDRVERALRLKAHTEKKSLTEICEAALLKDKSMAAYLANEPPPQEIVAHASALAEYMGVDPDTLMKKISK